MNDNAALRTAGALPVLRASPTPVNVLRRLCAVVLALLCALGTTLATGSPARADSASSGGDLQVAQTLGERELTVILRRVTAVPGPLQVDVLTQAGTPAGTLELRTASTGASTDAAAAATDTASTAEVKLGGTPGSYSTTLHVEQAGPWELVIDDGDRTSKIPFVVPEQSTSPPELAVYGGFVAAGVCLIVTLLVTVRARCGVWALLPAGGAVAALAVALTAALLSASLPLPPDPGQQVDPTLDNVARPYSFIRPMSSDYSRPPASLVVEPFTAKAGERGELRLRVTDGATGLPADDLVVHDDALVHLLIVGPAGELRHLHPVRTGRGTYEVSVRLPAAGHYAISAEFARRGGGVQQVRSAVGLDLAGGGKEDDKDGKGKDPPKAVTPPGPGKRSVDGLPVRLSASSLQAGKASTLTARVGGTSTLQPWLGMVGHMIVVGPFPKETATSRDGVGEAAQDAEVWAHGHSMGGMPTEDAGDGGQTGHGGHHPGADAEGGGGSGMDPGSMSGLMPVNGDSPADGTVAAYGPDASFVHTFPAPGHYRVWIQVKRDDAIVTIPYLLRITSPSGGGS